MMRRHLFRRSNGRFRQGSLERDMGIRVAVCPKCRGMTPYTRRESGGFIDPNGWEVPTVCGQCGEPLTESKE